jgi:hypothetical protein
VAGAQQRAEGHFFKYPTCGHAAHIPRGLKYNCSDDAWFDPKMLLAWFPKFAIHTSFFGIRR